jgi:hypothetical protein
VETEWKIPENDFATKRRRAVAGADTEDLRHKEANLIRREGTQDSKPVQTISKYGYIHTQIIGKCHKILYMVMRYSCAMSENKKSSMCHPPKISHPTISSFFIPLTHPRHRRRRRPQPFLTALVVLVIPLDILRLTKCFLLTNHIPRPTCRLTFHIVVILRLLQQS